jgi:hypothetical protein
MLAEVLGVPVDELKDQTGARLEGEGQSRRCRLDREVG